MKITVDRTHTAEGDLVFTITAKDAHKAPFGIVEKDIMDLLDICKDSVQGLLTEENKLKEDVIGLVHAAKERAFNRVLENLQFTISNELRPKFTHLCQEIYNWIYDAQEKPLKDWMREFDPQRTKYYFDNDRHAQSDYIMEEYDNCDV